MSQTVAPAAPLTPAQRDHWARELRPLVLSLVGRLRRRDPSLDADDLCGEGMLGLARALATWRPDGGAPLAVYVSLCARRQMLTWVRDQYVGRAGPLSERQLADLEAPESGEVGREPEGESEDRGSDEKLPAWTQCLTPDEWELVRDLESGVGAKARAARDGTSRDAARARVRALRRKVEWARAQTQAAGDGESGSAWVHDARGQGWLFGEVEVVGRGRRG